MSEGKRTIEYIAIDKLIPYKNNARTHSKEQIEKVADSISEFGFVNPVLINGDNMIMAGHGRVKAAKLIGMDKVPCLRIDNLTKEQQRAYILADNRLAEDAGWDTELLNLELSELDDAGFDIELTGFSLDDIGSDDEVIEDDFDAEPPEEPKSKLGDLYKLGKHRLLCGDSTDPESVKRLMGGCYADMVFTDPPYGVAIGDKNKILNKARCSNGIEENIIGDTLDTDELHDMLVKAMTNLRENCKDDCSYYVSSPQGGELGLMMMMMKESGLTVRHNLIWEKNNATFSMNRLDYDYKHEPIFYTWTKSHHYYGMGKCKTTILPFDRPMKSKLHPTMKPIPLVAEMLLNSSKIGDNVLDIFGGSGTTMIACEELDRHCFMMELDPKYVDVIINRWEELTGEKAEKIEE